MDAETSTTSSRSTAGHRLYRKQNLRSARIYFNRTDPAPPELLDLQARLLNTEEITLPSSGWKPVSLEIIAHGLQPVSDRARYEACLKRAQQIKSALDNHDFDEVEDAWMEVNDTVLQILMKDVAFEKT